jgi:hypothetical protein
MKRIILLIAFCLSLSAIYAQTIDVIHLKSGFDARGTITNRTESQITLQSENGRTLTIDMSEIESMEQEQKAFDPRVLIGRWACYKASGERDERYDMAISENMGFYTVNYIRDIHFNSSNGTIKSFPRYTPDGKGSIDVDLKDTDIENGIVSYRFHQEESCLFNEHLKREGTFLKDLQCDINLNFTDGILKGRINCTNYYCEVSYHNIDNDEVLEDGPGGKWNVYFVKY